MERLTIREENEVYVYCGKRADITEKEIINILAKKLAAYEDAEEQGRLVVLPCKVGERVYKAVKTWGTVPICCPCGEYGGMKKCSYLKEERKVAKCTGKMETDADGFTNAVVSLMFDYTMLPEIGKTVFLTREEAEKALEGMNNG